MIMKIEGLDARKVPAIAVEFTIGVADGRWSVEEIWCDVTRDESCALASAFEIFKAYLGMESVCSGTPYPLLMWEGKRQLLLFRYSTAVHRTELSLSG